MHVIYFFYGCVDTYAQQKASIPSPPEISSTEAPEAELLRGLDWFVFQFWQFSGSGLWERCCLVTFCHAVGSATSGRARKSRTL